jgi:hypothetical protein
VADLRAMMRNARGRSEPVHRAALLRLVEVSASDQADPVAHACWSMVFTIEEIRRENGRKVWRMHRLRPKIEKDGERAALEYCARNLTDGFSEVLGYSLPHLTAEAIVLRYPDAFAVDTLEHARTRLTNAGIDVDALLGG